MNYSYDIVLNYTPISSILEFYEWRREDVFTMIQKIPIFRVSDLQMNELMQYSFCMNQEFLKQIYNQTISDKEMIPYSFLVTDQSKVMAFLLDENGNVIQKSGLLLDEEDSVVEETIFEEITILDYEKKEKLFPFSFLTRREREIQEELLKKLHSLWEEKKYDEIQYLYQEFFHEKRSIKEKYQYLKEKIKNHYQSQYQKLYEIILLAEKEKEKI